MQGALSRERIVRPHLGLIDDVCQAQAPWIRFYVSGIPPILGRGRKACVCSLAHHVTLMKFLSLYRCGKQVY